ncbi:hypothetical protein [Streptomyces niger]|uniref:hypothetical protein n=1 Tax=Streptomyces niger TaxID=66373 RepID=UPI0018FE0BFD|nr:hypothetical protein [Streptomyces niger]
MSLEDLRGLGLTALGDDAAATVAAGMNKAQCAWLYSNIVSGNNYMYGSASPAGYVNLYKSQCKGKGPKLAS